MPYATLLCTSQLNATAVVGDCFVDVSAADMKLNAGNGQTLHVDFTPADTANYNGASKDVTINVLKATPVITWATPAAIMYPTALSATQLNATADVAGGFVYTPASGTVLGAASQALKADFTPTDTAN